MRSTTGHTFGGYARTSWNCPEEKNSPIHAAGCFLFLVENPHGDAPTCFECKNDVCAMLGHSALGPLFGGGHDLLITSDGSSSYIEFSSYTDTLGRGNATFTGAKHFTPEDYEVWAAAT